MVGYRVHKCGKKEVHIGQVKHTSEESIQEMLQRDVAGKIKERRKNK